MAIITLPSLMTDYTAVATVFTPSMTDHTVIAQANPNRWALIIVPTSGMVSDSLFRPDLVGFVEIDISLWEGRVEINNRDHPGLPQQQWIMGPSSSINRYQVVEVLKQPW